MFGPLNFPTSPTESAGDSFSKLTICLLCDKKFDLVLDREEFMNHILDSHGVIIKDCDCIIDLSRYVKFWKNKLESTSLKEVCGETESNTSGNKGEPCYIISDAIKEDKELRDSINKEALEKALERQQIERDDKQFKRQCLFCRHDIESTRAVYLNHLSSSHNLQLGKPDNLVYIDKYLDIIEAKIESLKCIFCEKIFKDRNVLKEHMRKKLHKRVNPRNSIYDQFYMVNYLAPGLSNKKFRQRKRRKSFDEEDDCDWSDWKEEITEPIVCLFCTDSFATWDSTLDHLSKEHTFSFKIISANLNFYEQVKVVNYIRRQIYRNQCIICDTTASNRSELLDHLNKEKHFLKPTKEKWDQPEYFFPTYDNDGFLYHLEDSSDQSEESEDENGGGDMKKTDSLVFLPGKEKTLPCLFCHYTDEVGDEVLQHMFDIHGFDYNEFTRLLNFMERVKLINYSRHQLKNNCCIECNQQFSDLNTVVDHMKQENHFHTPPKLVWDQLKFSSSNDFYGNTVDFLYALESVGNIKNDLDIDKEIKDSCFSDCDEDAIPIICLFCDEESSSWAQALSHLEKSHQFPYISLTSEMSFYDQVKMVTYMRKTVKKCICPVCEELLNKEDFLSHLESKNHFIVPPKTLWDKSEYYPASFTGDPFLSELNVHHATDNLQPTNSLSDNVERVDNKNIEEDINSCESDWGDWDEEMKIPVTCLLCSDVSDNWVQVHNHMKAKHNFSYHEISSGLMFYDQVKLVNYIRSQVASKHCFLCNSKQDTNDELLQHYTKENHLHLPEKQLWNKDKFFQPFLENDGFLSHIDDGDSDEGI